MYYQSKSNIVKFPEYERDENGIPTSPILKGSYELAADQKWHHIDIDAEKSQLTSEAQGEAPSQTQLNKLTAVHPGIDEEAAGLPFYVNNNDCVFIVEDRAGRARVVGSEAWQTKATVAQDNGQGTNVASTTLSVEATDETVAPFYRGTLDTEEGEIDFSVSPKE